MSYALGCSVPTAVELPRDNQGQMLPKVAWKLRQEHIMGWLGTGAFRNREDLGWVWADRTL